MYVKCEIDEVETKEKKLQKRSSHNEILRTESTEKVEN